MRAPQVYTTQSPSSVHTFHFGSTTPGNRVVLIINSYSSVEGISGGYDEHEWTRHTFGIRLLSKISTGDSSVTVNLDNSTDRITMWMFEVIGAEQFYGSQSGLTSGSATFAVPNLPDGCTAIMGVSVYLQGVDNSEASWPSGFTGYGYAFRDWPEGGNVRRVWSSAAVDGLVSGGLSVSQKLVTGLPSAHPSYAWAGAVFGPVPDHEAPTTPTGLRLTGMTPTSVSIAWDPSDDNSGVAGYGVYRNGVKVGGDQSSRTRTLTGLTTGVSYLIEVDAVDYDGNRSGRAQLNVTPINDVTPPTTPVVRVTDLANGRISIAWDEPYDDSAVVAYGIYLNGSKQGQDQTARTRTWTGLTPGGLYTVGVDARDLFGNRSQVGTRTVRAQPDTTPPSVPAGLRIVTATQTAITLAWDASTDDNVGVAGYGLYLGSRLVATVPTQVFTFVGLTPGITYTLAVDSVDDLGNRSDRSTIQATTLADNSGATPPYEYVMYDWESHEQLDSLPLQRPSMELGLAGSGQMTAEIPLYDEDYAVSRVGAATRPERTMVVAFRGERPVWIGRLIDPRDYDSETGILRLTAEEVVGIYNRRFVPHTGPRAGTYAHTEIDWLLDQMSQPADKRWLRTSGVAGTIAVDREYRAEDFPRGLDTIAAVADAPGGFDWWGKPDWDSVNDRPQVELRRVDRDDPPTSPLVLEYPGNVRKYRRSTRRGLATAVHGKLTISSGGVLLAKVVDTELHALGWPLTEDAHQFEGLTSQAALLAETQRTAASSRGSKQVFEFELAIGNDVRWWEWELGSLAQVVITDHLYPEKPDGRPGLDRPMKIVSLRVEPASDGGELVTVTTAELSTDVDEDEV